MNGLLTIKKASELASKLTNRNVSISNIAYLIQYGRVRKVSDNGTIQVLKQDLVKYYNSYNGRRERAWKEKLGKDLNWALSFEQYKEAETTKHVHRLHPYKGKFIPQLVGYFLDSHIDNFKRAVYFQPGDIVLDPFCGSGTTLVQANELGMHSIGVDVSAFNTFISNAKIWHYNFDALRSEVNQINEQLQHFVKKSPVTAFEQELLRKLNVFNSRYFPSSSYKYKLRQGLVNEQEYGIRKEREFLPIYLDLVKKYKVILRQDTQNSFLDEWYLDNVRKEMDFVFRLIKKIQNPKNKILVSIILSRTIRSCRATTHADLATLKEPVVLPYYCAKHGKICKPLFSLFNWWSTYSKDTLARLKQFEKIRTNTYQICLSGDSRTINLEQVLSNLKSPLLPLLKNKKIKGIFSSPPYVGLIDYHEQHAYAYDLFGFQRNDELEIGPLFKGQGREERNSYIEGISDVLNNCKKFLVNDYDIFLVANDKYNLYPVIAEKANMRIINQYKRPVLNRTEKDKGAFSEIIFHLKEK